MAHPIHPWPSIPLHLVPSPPFPLTHFSSLVFFPLLSYHRLPAISPPLFPFFCTLSASSKAFFLLELATLLSLSTPISSVKPSITQSQRPNDSASPPPPKQATLPSCDSSDDNTSAINQYIQLGSLSRRRSVLDLCCLSLLRLPSPYSPRADCSVPLPIELPFTEPATPYRHLD
ncbi:hypothetical protein FSOLCH5_009594 [Fusarium solani]